MAQNNSISVVGLDFDGIKQSLRNYMESQTALKDFNFDGSVMSTLLDVLAYNTHYQAFYTNMVANEMFLDSALLRPSIVSHAKQLGYTPSSTRSSTALVNINLTDIASSDTFIPRGSEFSGTNSEGTRYKFINTQAAFASAGDTAFRSVTLSEGTLRQITYIYNRDTKIGSYLVIPNEKADMSTLKVRVYSSLTDTTGISDVWTLGTDYLTLTGDSTVYFLQEKDAGIYEVYFGDGVLGKEPTTGNVVSIEYVETNGAAANGVVAFTSVDAGISSISFVADPTTGSTASESFGGSELESVSSIKFTAPKYYQTSNRAVTTSDYSALVYKLYPNASSVRAYGGETVTPPQYGKVYIAVKPISGGALSRSEKISLEKQLQTQNAVVSITPEIVDPDYTDLVFDISVVYNPITIPVDLSILKALIMAYVYGYSSTMLQRFGSNFYYSKMVEGINAIHDSVLGVYTEILLRKIIDIGIITTSKGYTFKFKNALYHPMDGHASILSSTTFPHLDVTGVLHTYSLLRDDGYGVVNVMEEDTENMGMYSVVYPAVGTLDYSTGELTLNTKFIPVVATGVAVPLIVTVKPNNTNISTDENQILRINYIYYDSVVVKMTTENADNAVINNSVR
jgi:hypothetical protein